jgi:hypothetical protein
VAVFLLPWVSSLALFSALFGATLLTLRDILPLQSSLVVASFRTVASREVPMTVATLALTDGAAGLAYAPFTAAVVDHFEYTHRLLTYGDVADAAVAGASRSAIGDNPLLPADGNALVRTLTLGNACALLAERGAIRNATSCAVYRGGPLARGLNNAAEDFLLVSRRLVTQRVAALGNTSLPYNALVELGGPDFDAAFTYANDFFLPAFRSIAGVFEAAAKDKLARLPTVYIALVTAFLACYAVYSVAGFHPHLHRVSVRWGTGGEGIRARAAHMQPPPSLPPPLCAVEPRDQGAARHLAAAAARGGDLAPAAGGHLGAHDRRVGWGRAWQWARTDHGRCAGAGSVGRRRRAAGGWSAWKCVTREEAGGGLGLTRD